MFYYVPGDMPMHWWAIVFCILHSALFVETWEDLWTLEWIMWGAVTILYCAGWWELEAHGHLQKLFSESEQWWRIMWWTLGTEINYTPKQLGHSLFLMELGPSFGFAGFCDVYTSSGKFLNPLLQNELKSWRKGVSHWSAKTWESSSLLLFPYSQYRKGPVN